MQIGKNGIITYWLKCKALSINMEPMYHSPQ